MSKTRLRIRIKNQERYLLKCKVKLQTAEASKVFTSLSEMNTLGPVMISLGPLISLGLRPREINCPRETISLTLVSSYHFGGVKLHLTPRQYIVIFAEAGLFPVASNAAT